MINKVLLISFFSVLTLSVFAQIPDGSTAPDFTLTDFDGNTHNLYEVLDEGKSVIIDFSATWCGICWNYHNSHAIEDTYLALGPDGTDEMTAYFIEVDANTNNECLYGQSGCNSSSIGDWTDGTTHPIFNLTGDDFALKAEYGVTGTPTIIAIAPNKKLYETGTKNSTILSSWVTESLTLSATATVDGNSIELLVENGFGDKTYAWSNGETTKDISGLDPGNYNVTITEERGHSIELINIRILEPVTISCPLEASATCSSNEISIFTSVSEFQEAGGIVTGAFDPTTFSLLAETTNNGVCPEIITRVYTITDSTGVTMECSYEIAVLDETAPILLSPSDLTLTEYPPVYLSLDEYSEDGGAAADNCSIDSSSFSIVGEQFINGVCATLNREYRVLDLCGNSATASQTIRIGLSGAAIIGYSFIKTGLAYEFISEANFGETFEWTLDGNVFSNNENVTYVFDEPGVYEVCHTAISPCGQLTSCLFFNTEVDSITVGFTCPESVELLCSIDELPPLLNILEWQEAGGIVAGDFDSTSLQLIEEVTDSLSCPETITRTYEIADINGSTYTCSQLITIFDELSPSMASPGDITISVENIASSLYETLDEFLSDGGEVFDNCEIDTASFIIVSEASNAETFCEILTRVYEVADMCGNTTTVTQIIDIELLPSAELDFDVAFAELNANFTSFTDFAVEYFWDFDDNASSTEANPMHTFSEDGNYNVCLTGTTSCGSKMICKEFMISSINNKELDLQNSIHVYPVPTSEFITIDVNDLTAIYSMDVVNVTGKIQNNQISVKDTQTISVENLSNGIYFLRIFTKDHLIIKKFVVNK